MHYGFNDDRSRYSIDTAIANAFDGIDAHIDSEVQEAVEDAIADALATTVADAIEDAVSAAVDSITARYDPLIAGKAESIHYHFAGDITSGTLDDGLISDTGWTYMIGNAAAAESSDQNFSRWRARGGIVYVQVMLRNNAGGAAGDNLNCGIIPEGYRPSAVVEDSAYLGANNDHSATVWIDRNGNIVARAAGYTEINKIYCSMSYPIG